MTEAAVHLSLKVEMVERVDEVCPVEVRVDSEHLTKDSLADLEKFNGKATTLTNPITRAGKLRKRCVKSGGSSGNRYV